MRRPRPAWCWPGWLAPASAPWPRSYGAVSGPGRWRRAGGGRRSGPAGGFVADFLVSNGMWQSAFLLLGVLMSLEELGALRVAIVAVSPLANLLAGIRSMTLAHMAGLRARPLRARRRATQLALALAGSAALYGVVLVLLPDRVGSELFGETWADAAAIVGIVAIAEVIRLPTFPAIDLVKVVGAPLDLVRTRLTGGVGVVSGLLIGGITGGPRGAAVGTAVGYTWNQLVWWRRPTRSAGDPRGGPRPRPDGRPARGQRPPGAAVASPWYDGLGSPHRGVDGQRRAALRRRRRHPLAALVVRNHRQQGGRELARAARTRRAGRVT